MKKMNKRVLAVVVAFVLVLGAVFAVSMVLNHKEYNENLKEIQLEIVSERDDYSKVESIETECESLGDLLRTLDYCVYEESTYGIYVHGFHEMRDDTANQYWWCLTINGESSMYGADETPLEDGVTYTFTLVQGW